MDKYFERTLRHHINNTLYIDDSFIPFLVDLSCFVPQTRSTVITRLVKLTVACSTTKTHRFRAHAPLATDLRARAR